MKPNDDLKKLMECLSSDTYLDAQDKMERMRIECNLCPGKATREITYKVKSLLSLEKVDFKLVTIQVCDECYFEDELWEGREIIKVTKL